MSAKTRRDATGLEAKYVKFYGPDENLVKVVEFETSCGESAAAAIGVPGHPVWTLAGSAPKWFVEEMKS